MPPVTIWINQIMQQFGYIGIAFLMFLDNIFPPIPSELIMPLAGFTASQGYLNIIGVIIAGSLGSILAAVTLYWIGRILNEDRLNNWLKRYGKWIFIKPKDLKKANSWFNQHGRKIVFFGRMIPAVRSIVSIPAGMARMPFGLFLLYTSLGTIIWTSILASLGFYLGQNYQKIVPWLSNASTTVLIIIIFAAIIGLYKYYKKSNSQIAN